MLENENQRRLRSEFGLPMLVTTAELAELLRCTVRTINRRNKAGEFDFARHRNGRRNLYVAGAILERIKY